MSHHPIIGSKYNGVPFDRPCLRQMPRDWRLEETRPETSQRWSPVVAHAFTLILVFVWVLMIIAQVV